MLSLAHLGTEQANDLGSLLPGLPSLRAESLGDPEVCVAVLDGPVEISHPCFQGANLTRLDTLVSDAAGNGAMSAHGTHITSLIFGQPRGSVRGIAPGCRGLILPVFRDYEEGRLSQLDLARAIEKAVQEGAHIINISGGERSPRGQADDLLARAVRECERNNVLVVAAVGNDGCECLHVPAALPGVLAVGAMGANGQPLDVSNWGQAYRENGVLAPGENIPGAVPGGGIARFKGSSFATPIVCGVAALLLSVQRRNGKRLDPRAVGEAILKSAAPCNPRMTPECPRYLAGTLNIPGAYALINKGGKKTMSNSNTTLMTPQTAEPGALPAETNAVATSEAGVIAAGVAPSGGSAPAGSNAETSAMATSELGIAAASVAPSGGSLPTGPTAQMAGIANSNPPAERSAKGGVVPAANCNCGNGKKANVFAIGLVSFDFGTEARRDSFTQFMRGAKNEDGTNLFGDQNVIANPYDARQLYTYLNAYKSESAKLIWTLNLDLTPIYAIEAELGYADEVYYELREALRGESLLPDDDGYVSRVSVPGYLTGRTVRLFSGQVVPVLVAQHRGMYRWNTKALTTQVIKAIKDQDSSLTADDEQQASMFMQNFLDKVYFKLRNLGQSSPDRALNFSATNAFQAAQVIIKAIDPSGAGLVPRPTDHKGYYTLDTTSVAKSPFCRFDSDCWDVQMSFFDPANILQASLVFQFTVDVSDEMPVTLGTVHSWTQK
jgi:cyanobactin maturation PatA/PatG family protease